ncbi:MAG TPA: peptide ABC transporter permease [Chloroflexi bacterium]|jgi:peptide/nickel transport system permease protein|nr:peptide ABC transporter permease [Chloroflexota bacterium]
MLDTRQVVSDDIGKKEWTEETELAFRQLSFKEMTYRRFMRHPIAKWAALTMGIIVVACYGAPIWHLLFPHFIQAPDQYDPSSAGTGPSLQHLFGTDSFNGHDIFSLVLYGGRLSLMIGVGSMVIGTIIGVTWGAVAGYVGGFVDAVMMRVTDVFLTVPALLLVPLASRIFGQAEPWHIAIIFGLLSWPFVSRIVRGSFLQLRELQFTEAAVALGATPQRIIFRHLLPNAVGPILVAFTLGVGSNVVLEAFVSFLGFGLRPPNDSWGSTLASAQEVMIQGNWWWITFPGLAVVATVMCINFIGDGLRDALDPKIVD